MRRDCRTPEEEIYGEYVHDIREGRDANKSYGKKSSEQDDTSESTQQKMNDTIETEPENTIETTVILGASNYKRVPMDESYENVHVAAVSGTTLEQVETLFKMKSLNEVEPDEVKNVIISLGTNDLSTYRHDIEQVIVNLTSCVEKVKTQYKGAKIGVCSIMPRRGKGAFTVEMNKSAQSVNTFTRKLCAQNSRLHYIDVWTEFTPNNVPNKNMYDTTDATGIHVSTTGAEIMKAIFFDFMNSTHDGVYPTPQARKRLRSSGSTPGSADKQRNKKPSR